MMDAQEYLEELIRYESTSSLTNEPIATHVNQVLQQLGFTTEWVEYVDADGVTKVSVVGKRGSGTGGFAYFGHTDVVPADDWHVADPGPYTATVRDGRLYGRGSCDMKGSIACMLAAAEEISTEELQAPLYIVCTADEEVGYAGAKEVTKQSKYYREMVAGGCRGVIGEPTRLEVVYAHKGVCGLKATSRGCAAHSSTSAGLNANLAMIPFLVEMKDIHDMCESSPEWCNEEFNPPTVSWNIGINDFTRAHNIKPPQSVCTVYFRPMPGQDPEVLIGRARRAAESAGIELEVVTQGGPLYVDPGSGFVQELLEFVESDRPQTVAYGTDGCVLQDMEFLAVLGPGDITQAHTNDEWIELEQLQKGTDLYARLIRHWCC